MFVIAITSCATGIAHSYMAAEAIKKVCKKNGHTCKVEIQGALGIENALSSKDIEAADLLVYANDVKISKMERFSNFPEEKIKRISPHDAIKNSEILFR
ncbi:PTS fructose transporter subunit IIB [Bacteroidia bacterium]|nr:PTS fructose transporter subunit IIB [Bacteroidia bacterium]